jgi:hypothetical protein
MLVDDARNIASALEQAVNAGTAGQVITATVISEEMQPQSIPAGAGRPTFRRYYIHIDDGSRRATLDLGQASGVLEEIEPDWDVDRLFDAIRAVTCPSRIRTDPVGQSDPLVTGQSPLGAERHRAGGALAERGNADAGHSPALDLQHGEAVIERLGALAGFWRVADPADDEAGEGDVVPFRKLDPDQLLDVVTVQQPVQVDAIVVESVAGR